MSFRLADYDFQLPDRLIAQRPPAGRSDARMMVLHRESGEVEHRAFAEFPGFLRTNDLAVLNNTRVRPARVLANEGAVELLFLAQEAPAREGPRWTCLVKPGRKARVGAKLRAGGATGIVEEIREDGERVIRFDRPPNLERDGVLPLPPYVHRPADGEDRERYQTVFARPDAARAIAAPTAGLHFTPEILARVPHIFITLDVGAGTFRPVKTEDFREHRMHAERFEITQPAAEAINRCVQAGGRVFAIGTTTVRVLEGCAREESGAVMEQSGETRVFIHPPRRIQRVQALLTNFHLPKSTLLLLVSAFAGREFVLRAYQEAVRESYRFFSYGDCMLIL